MAAFAITGEISVDLGKAQQGIIELTKSYDNCAKAIQDAEIEAKLSISTEEEAAKKKIAAINKYIAALNDQKMAAYKNKDLNKKASDEQIAKIDETIKALKKQSAQFEKSLPKPDGFFKGMIKGFKELPGEATKMGANVIKGLGPLGLVMAAIALAINLVKDAFGKAVGSSEAAQASFANISAIIDKTVKPIFEKLGEAIAWVADRITGLMEFLTGKNANDIKLEILSEESAAAQMASLKEFSNEMEKISVTSRLTNMKEEDVSNARISARKKYIDVLIEERQKLAAIFDANSQEIQQIERKIQFQTALVKNEEDALKVLQDKNKVNQENTEKSDIEQRIELQKRWKEAMLDAEAAAKNAIENGATAEEAKKIRQDALAKSANDIGTALDRLAIKYDYANQSTPKFDALREDVHGYEKAIDAVSAAMEKQTEINKTYEDAAKSAEEALAIAMLAGIDGQEAYTESLRKAAETAALATAQNMRGLDKTSDAYQDLGVQVDNYAEKSKKTTDYNTEAIKKQKEIDKEFHDARKSAEEAYNVALLEGVNQKEAQKQKEEAIRKASDEAALATAKNLRNVEKESQVYDELNKKVEDYADGAKDGNAKVLAGMKKFSDGLNQVSNIVGQAGESIMSIMNTMAQNQIATIENILEEQKALIDQQYEETMERLDEERQKALEMAGFVQTTTEEGLAASMEAAIASGDEGVIYKEKRRQEELAINQKYDDLEKEAQAKKDADTKAAERKAAQDKAEVDYQMAMAEWTMKMMMAPAQAASAILKAMEQFGPVAGAIVGGALTALQIADLAMAMPKKQSVKFAKGGEFSNGIYESPTPFLFADGGEFRRGIMGEAGPEAVMPLVRDAAGTLGVNAANAGGSEMTVNVVLMLDGSVLSQSTVRHINNGDTVQIDGFRVS